MRSRAFAPFFVACWLIFLSAASVAAPASTLRFEQLSVEHGLAQEIVTAITQDRQGFMWFGSQNGLSRFDGYRVTVYKSDAADSLSLADNLVHALYADEEGRLWVGTRGGLQRFDPVAENFVRFVPKPHTQQTDGKYHVHQILPDGRGALWLATNDGLQHFDPKTGQFEVMRHDDGNPDSIIDNQINALALDAKGTLWIGTEGGMDRLPSNSSAFQHFSVATTNSTASTDKRTRKTSDTRITALWIDHEQTLWVGTRAGLESWSINKEVLRRRAFGYSDGILSDSISTIYEDSNNNLWVGVFSAGLYRRSSSGRFISHKDPAADTRGGATNEASTLFQDRTGTIWVGTWTAGVKRVDLASGGFSRFFHIPGDPTSLRNNRVYKITGDGQGGVWLETDGYLSRLDPVTGDVQVQSGITRGTNMVQVGDALTVADVKPWTDVEYNPKTGFLYAPMLGNKDPKSRLFSQLLKDRAGNIWLTTQSGVYQLVASNGSIKYFTHAPADANTVSDNDVDMILEDSQGIIWLSTEHGLNRLDPASGHISHFRHDPKNPFSLKHDSIQYLFCDKKGTLWVGTTGGLHRMETVANGEVRFHAYTTKDGLGADSIGAILQDKDGNLWISTTAGISRFDPITAKFQNYTARDGMIDGTYFVGSAFQDASGMMYFGGFNGLTVFRPETIHENQYPPTPAITDFHIFNQSVRAKKGPEGFSLSSAIHDAKALTLSYRDFVISLEFSALHYADPQRNRYAYQLLGFDKDWVFSDANKRIATYTNLDPGHYVFHVKAANKDGVWSQNSTSLEITITPPIWKTWWFLILATALLLGSIWAAYRVRIRGLTTRQALLEKQVSIRTAEVVRQKEIVEEAHHNISVLSEVGRTITATLDRETILATVHEQIKQLIKANQFRIGLCNCTEGTIEFPFVVIEGERSAPYSLKMDDAHQLPVWCAANGKAVFINDINEEIGQYQGATQPTHQDGDASKINAASIMIAPMLIKERVMGVISVESLEKNAYQRTHLDMLMTLAAYVAVALDNADAYHQLQDAQTQLVSQGKMAALGSLVAGVAHELNTPIGNSLTAASFLVEQADDINSKFDDNSMRRSDLSRFLTEARQCAELLIRGLQNAADLVSSFKQVAVDRTSEQRRQFLLRQASEETMATLMSKINRAGHTITLDIPDDIIMDSYPGPFGQVISNLINNALLHGLQGRTGGRMLLMARPPVRGNVQIEFSDNGVGISDQHIHRIFEPFFTTKLGQGGSGLGLHISHNIVTSTLGGQITVRSMVGQGTTFILALPLNAPLDQEPDVDET